MDQELPHIVFVTHNPMGPGGFQTVTRNLLKRLDGFKRDVIAIEQGTSLLPYNYDGYGIYEVSSICGLRHYLAELMPDLVIVYGAYWHMNQYLEAIKNPVCTQALYLVVEAAPIPKKWHADLGKFEMIMTPSIASAEAIVDVGYDGYIVHHGVDLETFSPGPKEEDKFLYGTVKVNNFKAQLGRLMIAYNEICKDQNSMLLIHANPIDVRGTPLKDMAQTYDIEDYVRFSQQATCSIGMLDLELVRMYRNLSVYVSTSGGDTVNLPALEAAACGIPSILTDVPGPQEYLGTSATYVPSIERYPSGFGQIHLANTKLLADALHEYYVNDDLRIEKGKLAREYALQWPWERSVAELKKNLESLI